MMVNPSPCLFPSENPVSKSGHQCKAVRTADGCRRTVEELEKELLDGYAKESAEEGRETSTDARGDVEDMDGTALKASLRNGTGVFEGREDSPDVGSCLCEGTGVFEGRDDSPDLESVTALVQKVESNPFRRLGRMRRACKNG